MLPAHNRWEVQLQIFSRRPIGQGSLAALLNLLSVAPADLLLQLHKNALLSALLRPNGENKNFQVVFFYTKLTHMYKIKYDCIRLHILTKILRGWLKHQSNQILNFILGFTKLNLYISLYSNWLRKFLFHSSESFKNQFWNCFYMETITNSAD